MTVLVEASVSRRVAVSNALPHGTARLDRRQMDREGGSATSPLLPTHARWPQGSPDATQRLARPPHGVSPRCRLRPDRVIPQGFPSIRTRSVAVAPHAPRARHPRRAAQHLEDLYREQRSAGLDHDEALARAARADDDGTDCGRDSIGQPCTGGAFAGLLDPQLALTRPRRLVDELIARSKQSACWRDSPESSA